LIIKIIGDGEMSIATERREHLGRLGSAFRALLRNIEAVREEAARSQKLHPTDLSAIEFLYRLGEPASVKQLISHMNLTSGSGTALLDRLERSGFVQRIANPNDRRSWLIELDAGQAKEPIRRLREMEQIFIRASENLSDEELIKVANFIEAVSGIASAVLD
jgi:DNA-binding MarR family transcriptional regulator